MNYYFAPLEGITDYIYRNAFAKYYGGIDKYYTPFLSPNQTKSFQTKELKNINPENNAGLHVVPQLLTRVSEHFIWACEEIRRLGYGEINLNLGCPSGTVVSKRKGSGLLYYPKELDSFLYDIYEKYPGDDLKISIKTRLGKNDPEEFYDIVEIYKKYPIYELTVHPRIQKDFYREEVRMEYFDYAMRELSCPVVYNGEIRSKEDAGACAEKYPNLSGIMIGRGFIMRPWMLGEYDRETLLGFMNELAENYSKVLFDEKTVMFRLKEIGALLSEGITEDEKERKALKKCQRVKEYMGILERIC